jgi:hypothetical protein
MLDQSLSKWGRRAAIVVMAAGGIYAFIAAISETGPARPIIALQAQMLGRYSLKLTAVVLLLPAVLVGYAAGFLFDFITRQGVFAPREGFDGDGEFADAGLPRKVRIIAIPPGEAPESVRKAWVGLELPLAPGEGGARFARGFGVLSGPKSTLAHITRSLNGEGIPQRGYVVDGQDALEVLTLYAPEAARWWEENAPYAVARGRKLIFAAEVCKEV